MPQIAQQDYIHIVPAVGLYINVDAFALGQLLTLWERGGNLIYDVILHQPEDGEEMRILGTIGTNSIFWYSRANGLDYVEFNATPVQYEGLAAIQLAAMDTAAEEILKSKLPVLTSEVGKLYEDGSGFRILDSEGHEILITLDGRDKLIAVEVSDTIYTGNAALRVPFEDIQKLIGLKLYNVKTV